jgi:fatty acid-binding protein DegV
MVKNCFVFDSCVDFANKAFDNVYVMPLSVIENVNGKAVTYEDGIQITTNEIEKGMIEGKIYKTSQTPLGKALELFEELSKKYDNVYVLPIHTKLSGQINSLNLLAKEEFSNVFVIPQVGISLGST